MKTKSIYVAAVALALMVTGCSDDDQFVQVKEPTSEGHQVRVTASMGVESRLAVVDTGKRLEFTWEDDDVFHVFDPANNQTTVFEKEASTSQEPSVYGTFVGTPQKAYTDGAQLYAIYNKQQTALQLDADGNVTLDISQQSGELDEQYQFMFSEAKYSETANTAFPFRHLVTMVKLNLAVPEEVTKLKKIYFRCNNMPVKATLVLNKAPYDSYEMFEPGDVVSCYDTKTSTDPLVIQGDFVPENGIVTVYLYTLPVKEYYMHGEGYNQFSMEPIVWMTDDKGIDYVGVVPFESKEVEAGKTYQLNTDVVGLEPFANETTATGLSDNPYEIATAGQLYAFMYRTSKNMVNSDGLDYNRCYYKLTADIQLNNETLWIPTELYDATFDGNGKTISGNITMHADYQTGLFSGLYGSTVQDLILDLNVTFDNESNRDCFGMLSGYAVFSEIINCVNHSDVSGYFSSMAGLIGSAVYTQITACGNTGKLTSLGENGQMGGIVAEAYSEEVYIEGCYNTGHFEVNTMSWGGLKVGGIVGRISSDNNYVQSCWSNATLSIENVNYDDHILVAPHNIFFGGIVGYQNAGTISNCYWNDAVEFATGHENGTITGGGTFAGTIPDAEQIAQMNAAMTNSDYEFDVTTGAIVPKNSSTSLP